MFLCQHQRRYCSRMGAVLLKSESCMQEQWWWTKIRLGTIFKQGNLGSGIWAFIIDLSILLKGRHDYYHIHWQKIWFHHGDLYRERGLLTSEGKEMKCRKVILILSEAICLPKRVTIMHFKGHQKGGFLWSHKQWNSWFYSMGNGLRMSGTSRSLNSPSRTQITGPPGMPQGILTGPNKNWTHELTMLPDVRNIFPHVWKGDWLQISTKSLIQRNWTP